MPFSRRRFTKRRSSRSIKRKASPSKYYKKAYPVRKALVQVAKKVKRIEDREELKVVTAYNSTSSNSPLFTTLTAAAPQVYLINGILRGAAYNARIADKVRVTSVQVNLWFYFASIAGIVGADNYVRVMLVQYKKPRGQAMTLYTSLIGAGTTALFYNNGGGKPAVMQHIDWGVGTNAYEQFHVHYDQKHRVMTHDSTYNGTNQCINASVYVNIRKKLNLIVDHGRGNNGDVTDMETNALYVVCISDGNQAIAGWLDSRVYFKDA